MKVLHCLVQPVLGAIANHEIRVLQILLISLQELVYHNNYHLVVPRPARG